MTIQEQAQEFYAKLEAAGHKLRRNEDGDVDCAVLDSDYHNGPGCDVCGETWCEHCFYGDVEPCIREEGVVVRNEKRKELRIKVAVELLRENGYTVEPPGSFPDPNYFIT